MTWRDWYYKLPWATRPADQLVTGLHAIRGDGDAVVLFPYDDGTLYPKRGYWETDLIGGMGGYETPDEDKVVVDGDGAPSRELYGVPVVLACDPTEHAGAVEVLKSMLAQKHNIGEWVRADRQGNIVEVGEALVAAQPDGGVDEPNLVTDRTQQLAHEQNLSESEAFDRAMTELRERGDVRTIYDLAPPAAPVVEDGEVRIEEATHIAVDQAKAADLVPKKYSTEAINVSLDKARMEEYEEGRDVRWFVYGAILGSSIVGVLSLLMLLLFLAGG